MLGILDFVSGSKTLALALSLIPLLGSAHEDGHADDWVFDRLPKRLKKNAILAEFEKVLSTGKAFLAACWAFFHS